MNDDLGAFADLARRMGQAAAETEARILVTLLEAGSCNGPTMSDGKTLFHADHGNKAGTGAAISDATLSAARLALRTQKGIEDRTIRVTPRNLLVPPALETTAEKWSSLAARMRSRAASTSDLRATKAARGASLVFGMGWAPVVVSETIRLAVAPRSSGECCATRRHSLTRGVGVLLTQC